MMKKEISYDELMGNIDSMINLLEFDAMRSAGKMKLNSQHLHSLYYLKELYTDKVKKPVAKKVAAKVEG